MIRKIMYRALPVVFILLLMLGCKTFQKPIKTESKVVPLSFGNSQDSASIIRINWKEYFSDENLVALIDSALRKNQELNITIQEVEILRNEVRTRRGSTFPLLTWALPLVLKKKEDIPDTGMLTKVVRSCREENFRIH